MPRSLEILLGAIGAILLLLGLTAGPFNLFGAAVGKIYDPKPRGSRLSWDCASNLVSDFFRFDETCDRRIEATQYHGESIFQQHCDDDFAI